MNKKHYWAPSIIRMMLEQSDVLTGSDALQFGGNEGVIEDPFDGDWR